MSILGPEIPGARVLDLFAGTGALGLETLSRGARRVRFVDSSHDAVLLLRKNIEILGVRDRTRITRANALSFLAKVEPGAYDLALADPPYASDFAERLVTLFRKAPFARTLAVEHAAGTALPGDDTRRYGDTALTFCHAP